MKIKIGISARHVHLTKEDLNVLFGENYELTKKSDLTQTGEFASNETVTIKTDKREIPNVRILGPVRSYTQIEVSKTDAHQLGLNPPVRRSGDITGSSPITIIGPHGELKKEEGCIIANRHIHITEEDAVRLNLQDNQKVSVYLDTEKRAILKDVEIKVNNNYVLELHLDTDDGNANLVTSDTEAELIIE